MAKAYRVTPRRQPGRESYIANFYDARGNRVTRGIGTSDQSKAELICAGLARLHTSRAVDAETVPVDVPMESVKLYFGEGAESPVLIKAAQIENLMGSLQPELKRFPKEVHAKLVPVLMDRLRLEKENATQRAQIASLIRELDQAKAERKQLESSVVVRTMQSAAKSPALSVALQGYREHLAAKSNPKHVDDMAGRAEAFIATMSADNKVASVEPAQISAFLNEKSLEGDPKFKATRFAYWRVRLGAFFNWAAKQYGYASQMDAVHTVARSSVERERGDIHWHELSEVQAAVKRQTEPYWKALVGTLGYAGLRLAELIWLRTSDVKLTKSSGTIWVTTVEDADDPEDRHALKTGRSKRAVNVHSKLLLPLLRSHVKEGGTGKFYFFPMPPTVRRRVGESTSDERWLLDSLSTKLRGHVGGKNRKTTAGILPPGMNAKSLRRTFGSLLLRSRKPNGDRYSLEEVAAAMGNSPQIVSRHYARILGSEVVVQF